jgi:hypothetical protein
VQKDPKSVDPDSTANRFLAGTIHIAGPDNDIRKAIVLAIFGDELILLHFSETVGVPSAFGMSLDWAGLIQQSPPGVPFVGIDSEGTNGDQSTKALVSEGGFDKVSRGDNGVHEGIRKRLLPCTRGQVKDHRSVLGRRSTILPGKKVPSKHVHPCIVSAIPTHGFQP